MREATPIKPAEIRSKHERKFGAMLRRVLQSNRFYQEKYERLGFPSERPAGLSDLRDLPFTLRAELIEDQQANPPFGSNLTFPLSQYTRVHQTVGATGETLYWLDTAESWRWWLDCWEEVYQAAGVTAEDRIFFTWSLDAFIGLWSGFEAGQQIGALVIPRRGGGPQEQLHTILLDEATVLVSTPAHAAPLTEAVRREGRNLGDSPVRLIILVRDSGAGVFDGMSKLETAWNAKCHELALATELGPWGYGCGQPGHMHINEAEFIVEVVDPQTRQLSPVSKQGIQRGELVVTNLGRVGSPLIRYCTGNLVELSRQPCSCGRNSAVLKNGVLRSIDGMRVA